MKSIAKLLAVGGIVVAARVADAQTYSLDRTSPSVDTYLAHVHRSDDLLMINPTSSGEDIGGNGPVVNMPGSLFRGPFAPIDVDAVSSNHGSIWVGPTEAFKIVFSVRPGDDDAGWSVGEQHIMHQQPADLFISAGCYHPMPPCGPHGDDGVIGNDLYRGQKSLDLVPTIADDVAFAGDDPDDLDNLDALDFQPFDADNDDKLDRAIYFSVTEDSRTSYGGFIFYLPSGTQAPTAGDFPPVYATRIDIGLLSSFDELDGLIVFDADNNGVWSVGDAVLLSLKAGSPSLTTAGSPYRFALDGHAADVFMVYRGGGGICVTRLVEREDLGFLLAGYSDIDALEILRTHVLKGDANCDGAVDGFDIEAFVLALTDPDKYASTYPQACGIYNVDINDDGLVTGFDIEGFVDLLGG